MEGIEYYKKRSAKIPVNLDFSEKENFDYIMSITGGEACCKKEYPAFYQLCETTRELHMDTHGLHYETLLQRPDSDEMMDDLFISCLFYDQGKSLYSLEAKTSFMNEKEFLLQQFIVCDEKDRILFKDYTLYPAAEKGNSKDGCFGESIRAEFTVEEGNKNISAFYTAVWKEGQELRAQIYGKSFLTENITGGAGVRDFQMINPVKKHGTGPIVVVYNRRPNSKEYFIDYNHDEKIDSDGQELYLRVSGTVEMEDESVIMDVFPNDIILRVTGRGTVNYKPITEQDVKRIFPDLARPVAERIKKPFHFSFDLDWGGKVPARRLPLKDPVDFFMVIPYILNNYTTGHLIASSTAYSEAGPHVRNIPQLLLLWGCLGENSLITMADQSQRPIQEVRIGEMVMGMKLDQDVTETFYVSNIICGHENILYVVETEDGKSLACSDSHVFRTLEGMKQVRNLCGQDILIDEHGRPLKITALYPRKEGTVYNLMLKHPQEDTEKGAWMLANGLWNGDFIAQNQAERPRLRAAGNNRLLREAISIRKELDAWKQVK